MSFSSTTGLIITSLEELVIRSISVSLTENLKSFSKDAKWSSALNGKTYISASAGNHGISLAAGARIFGAKAVIYLSKNVPSSFADKIRSFGAEVVVYGNDYEVS